MWIEQVVEITPILEKSIKPEDPWWVSAILGIVFIGMAFFWVGAMEATLDANSSMKKR